MCDAKLFFDKLYEAANTQNFLVKHFPLKIRAWDSK